METGLLVGLFFIALAVYLGLSEIAAAIRQRNVDVNFRGPITLKSYHDE